MRHEKLSKMKNVLISVSNKKDIVEFTGSLQLLGFNIYSTGGTKEYLENRNVTVKSIEEYTEFPEILAGRVKTIHPKIFGGILANRGIDDKEMKSYGIIPFDLVVVNLYPFKETISNKDHTIKDAIENIDIGGHAMIRAAAKNHKHVAVVVDSDDYNMVFMDIADYGYVKIKTRI